MNGNGHSSNGLNLSTSRGTVEQNPQGIVRITDPETGRFLFEYDVKKDIVIWRERGRRIEVPLACYREVTK